MARSNLLNTRTATLMDLIGNGKAYQVPPYQRNYSWTEEQWEDLWNDILALADRPDDRHYMGALVVEAQSEREFLIIDGQQRLTTLSVLALAIIDRLQSTGIDEAERHDNQERAKELRRRFISDRNLGSLLETSKLKLNETNGGFYEDYLVPLRTPINLRGQSRSNRLLWHCLDWFKAILTAYEFTGEQLWRLLEEAAGLRLMFILITVDDELSAYTVFETLNARGLELSTTDLLKNWLFSRLRDATDRAVLQRRWTSLMAVIEEQRFPDFLRYHLLCDNSRIRKERMFKLVRDLVPTGQQVFSLIEALERRAELFAALTDPEHGYWIELPDARRHVRELKLFRVRQPTPLLFAAWETLAPTDFVRVLKLVSTVTLRHTIIGGRNTNELEPVYHNAAKALLIGTAKTPRDVFSEIKSIYIGDAEFIDNFYRFEADFNGQRKQLAKYLLCKLESHATHRHVDFETDPATIEHILPQNPAAEWDAFFPLASQQGFTYMLGNLTLLEAAWNRRVGNGPLATKRAIYAQSAYRMTQLLAESAPEEWRGGAIIDRQAALARQAVQIWRADFD